MLGHLIAGVAGFSKCDAVMSAGSNVGLNDCLRADGANNMSVLSGVRVSSAYSDWANGQGQPSSRLITLQPPDSVAKLAHKEKPASLKPAGRN